MDAAIPGKAATGALRVRRGSVRAERKALHSLPKQGAGENGADNEYGKGIGWGLPPGAGAIITDDPRYRDQCKSYRMLEEDEK
jgi:hypothetical protein